MTSGNMRGVKYLFLFVLVVLGLAFWATKYSKPPSQPQNSFLVPNTTPSQAPNIPFFNPPEPKNSEVHSSDGKMKLVMETKATKEGDIYTFVASEINGDNPKTIFTQTVDPATGFNFSLPFNSWSPNNKYLFIRQERAGLSFLVFKSSGESFAGDAPYYDVVELYAARKLKFILKDVTGWASNTLLIVTTTKEDGSNGPSYWFDLESKAFLQLRS